MKVKELFQDIDCSISGDENTEVTSLHADSRNILKGGLFFAVVGESQDGHEYVDSAIEAGAGVVVYQKDVDRKPGIVYIKVENVRKLVGLVAGEFYGHPDRKVKVVAVTGTNGKTSVATIMYQLVTSLGKKAGLLSTVEHLIGSKEIEKKSSTPSTPPTIELFDDLRQMTDAGCEYCFIEATSHALVQDRLAGVHISGAIFMNLTQDHLDYHGSMGDYADAKKILFDNLPTDSVAVINKDDQYGEFMTQNCVSKVSYFSKKETDYYYRVLQSDAEGLNLQINDWETRVNLPGNFNAENFVASFAMLTQMGESEEKMILKSSELVGVPGRMQKVPSATGVVGIVDYAHTPDALESVLKTLQEVKGNGAKVISVSGSGGDRDPGKRPMMARAAEENSDIAILTTDNPRTEDPAAILEDVKKGLKNFTLPAEVSKNSKEGTSTTVVDRTKAIELAVSIAQEGDIVVVAGKGHEDYQEVNGVKLPYDDREELEKVLKL